MKSHFTFVPNAAAIAALVLASFTGALAQAQSYPARPIRVISTFQPGVIEAPLRAMTAKMSESLGQPVIVEVQAGAGGVIGSQTVARAAPDGYTILFTSGGGIVTTPLLLKARPFDPIKDFTPITTAINATLCLMVSATVPANSVRELIAYARANPGKLAYGSAGVGSSYHLLMELIKSKNGLDITHVPYKAGSDALIALVGNQIPIAFGPASAATPYVKAGKVRILAVLDTQRYAGLPDIPSMSEELPDYEPSPGGMSFYGPAGMPAPIVQRIYAEIAKSLKTPEVLEALRKIAFFPVGTTPAEASAQMKKDLDIAARSLQAAGITPE